MTVIDGMGTQESVWLSWLDDLGLPRLDIERWQGARVLVTAAHPDDEVLGVAGLLSLLTAYDAQITVVWATDGEASHPGSSRVIASELAARRRRESEKALETLEVPVIGTTHLGFPDSGLAAVSGALDDTIRDLGNDADLVIAPWRADGHPDHEAVGRAAAAIGKPVLEYPIWMWHWASPEDVRVPWSQCRAVPIDVERKRRAIHCFESQIEPLGPDPEDAAVLPPHVLDRFSRPFEVVIV